MPANMDELLESGDVIRLKQEDGSTEYNVRVQNDEPWHPKEKLQTAQFVLPQGYDKLAFSLETRGNAGDEAQARWASDNPGDARIVLHVKTSRSLVTNDGVTAVVHSVFGIRKDKKPGHCWGN